MKILRTIWLVETREGLKISVEAYKSTPAMENQLQTLIIRCSCSEIEDPVMLYPLKFSPDHILDQDEILDLALKYCEDKGIETHG